MINCSARSLALYFLLTTEDVQLRVYVKWVGTTRPALGFWDIPEALLLSGKDF